MRRGGAAGTSTGMECRANHGMPLDRDENAERRVVHTPPTTNVTPVNSSSSSTSPTVETLAASPGVDEASRSNCNLLDEAESQEALLLLRRRPSGVRRALELRICTALPFGYLDGRISLRVRKRVANVGRVRSCSQNDDVDEGYEWAVNEALEEVPTALPALRFWAPVLCGRQQREEGIAQVEAQSFGKAHARWRSTTLLAMV